MYVLLLFSLSSLLSLSTTLPCFGKISVASAATRGKLSCAAWEVLVVVETHAYSVKSVSKYPGYKQTTIDDP